MSKTKTVVKNAKPKNAEFARLVLPVQQAGLEKWAAQPDDVIGRAADSPATVVSIPLAAIVESSENARRSFDAGELDGLAQSMRAVGLREPVELKPRGKREDGSPGGYELVDGARRYRAAKILGWKEVPAFIHDEQDLVTATVRAVRNNQRVNLTPYEEALDFKNIMDKGATIEQVAALVGRSKATVEQRLELLALPEDVGRRVGEATFPIAHAKILIPLAKDEKIFTAAKKAIGETDHDGRPLDANRFQYQVAAAIERAGLAKNPDSYDVVRDYQVREHPSFRKGLKEIPHVQIGQRTLVTDTKALKVLVDETEKKVQAKRAAELARSRASGARKLSAADSLNMAVEREMPRRLREIALKAGKATSGFGGREMRAILADVLRGAEQAHVKALSEVSGVPEAKIKPCVVWGGQKKAYELVTELQKKKDHGPLARLVMTAFYLKQIANWRYDSGMLNAIAKDVFGASVSDVKARAKKDLAAKRKAKGRAKPAKAPRSKAPGPDEDVDVDEDLDDDGEE